MARNSTGTIANVVDVESVATYSYSAADDMAAVSEIPLGGTTLFLPAAAVSNGGDTFAWGNSDGSCSSTHPLTIAAGTGSTIRGGASLVMTSAYAAGRVQYDQGSESWIVLALSATAAVGTVTLTGDVIGSGPSTDVPTEAIELQSFAGPMTPPENGSWAQDIWYIDALNSQGTSSNANNGLTKSTALLTFAEAVRRLGTISPVYPVGSNGVVLQFLSNDLTETVNFEPVLNQGALVNIIGTPTLVATVTLASFEAKTAAGAATCALGGSAAAGLMLVNTTRGDSVAFIDSVAGATSTITQPFGQSVTAVPPAAWWLGGGSGLPAENNAWANGDTVQLYELTQVNFGRLAPTTTGVHASTGDGLLMFVGHIWAVDLSGDGPGIQPFQVSTTVRLTECRVDAWYAGLGDANNGVAEQIFNCWMNGGGNFLNIGLYGGAFNSSDNAFTALKGATLAADAIVHGILAVGSPGSGTNAGVTTVAGICLVTGSTLSIFGPALIQEFNYGINTLYGTYTVETGDTVQPGQLYYNNTAELTFLGTPTLLMNTHATAQGLNRSTGQFFFGISLTPALLDTATPTGFGGIALSNDLQSVIARQQAL